MANSDYMYERWRKLAAQQGGEDRYTGLWTELTGAHARIEEGEQARGFYQGLLVGYALVTGDSTDFVHAMVEARAKDLVAS